MAINTGKSGWSFAMISNKDKKSFLNANFPEITWGNQNEQSKNKLANLQNR